MPLSPVAFAQELIRCPSVTPDSAGVMDVLDKALSALGFVVTRKIFEDPKSPPVENLYARLGTSGPHFCFAGHTDVVPVGDAAAWTYPPFGAEIHDGVLYGRGAEDMKGAVAAFVAAVSRYVEAHGQPRGSISLLITQDEEALAINGTRKMLDWMKANGEVPDVCVVGEPTNRDTLGDTLKIGRRGSSYFDVTVKGKQGHAAYPERADNPVTKLVRILEALKAEALDAGTPDFPPSNMEITSIDVGNPTRNLIPAQATALMSIRFNVLQTPESLEEWIRAACERFAPGQYEIGVRISGDAFLTRNDTLVTLAREAVREVTGHDPELSTGGGTSDARFIKNLCPVVEFGTTGVTPHQVNECVSVQVLEDLSRVYEAMLRRYFVS